MFHAPCSMLTPSFYPLFGSDVRFVPRYIAARSLFRWFLKICFGFSFCDGKTLWISLFLHLLEGNFPPLFLFFLSLSPSTIYHLPPPVHGPYPPLTTSTPFLFYGRIVLLLHYLLKVFSLPFLIKSQIIKLGFSLSFVILSLPSPLFFSFRFYPLFYILYGSC